ncbi:hypothetical protein K503DRAFT_799641 [Rhizopogon vinicolor AM-OR11-026]|uniref:DUF6593 domain-containing protein n=1 Tax=Rhizopogon vinicolor AM-OR11-026 TaxID=1314800 RepID=A0A1B7N3M2_9AGAM|nr:hypothetical protein K503DRAFT_799641 [Rhizopogon vinicolor AM-OR11-026]
MDSATTLVNPGPPTYYFLTSTNLANTTIYTRPDIPLYTITDTSDGKLTKINDQRTPGRTIATFHQREILPNTVSFPERNGGAPISVQKWLRRSKLADGTTGFVMETDYGPYVWKIVSRHRQKVYAQCDLTRPIASCSLHPTLSNGRPAFSLEYDAEPLREDIVVAYLLQRQRVMSEDKAIELFVGSPS